MITYTNSDLQIGVRGRVFSSEHAHFENFRPQNSKPKARAQHGKPVLVVVLVLQSEGREGYFEALEVLLKTPNRPVEVTNSLLWKFGAC